MASPEVGCNQHLSGQAQRLGQDGESHQTQGFTLEQKAFQPQLVVPDRRLASNTSSSIVNPYGEKTDWQKVLQINYRLFLIKVGG